MTDRIQEFSEKFKNRLLYQNSWIFTFYLHFYINIHDFLIVFLIL
jgi:hypothetical protein